MCLFKKKNKTEKLVDNLTDLKELVKRTEVLISMTTNEDFKQKLTKVRDEIAYAKTSTNPSVVRYQNKISNLLDDIKIKISANKEEKVENMINEILLLIKERDSVC